MLDTNFSAGFVIYEDRPNNYDAWDVDIGHLETPTHLKGKVIKRDRNFLRASVTVEIEHAGSVIEVSP